MSATQILFLGGVAGATIFLGLPLGRMKTVRPPVVSFLSAMATGILLFLLWDVLSAAVEPVEEALTEGNDGRFVWLAALLGGGFAVGLLSLGLYDGWLRKRRTARLDAGAAASIAELSVESRALTISSSRWLAIFIATGIGLHNFSEGLAIGQSAAAGEISLALALIVGFGLHNATEGFGIVAPLAGDEERPSWGFLALLGLLGGGPTFIGTIVGQAWVNTAVSVLFLALAAGSILYVVIELISICSRLALKQIVLAGILVGLVLGFGTDFILVALGA